ncbi:MAG: DMT family transporter [Flavobacteriaceae bacterium]|nr:DMT family transporter [Flavobacteriaceae bacterium]
MPNARFKSLLHLHFLVFIWGFTSILGALMNKSPFEIVWFRVVIASSLIAVYFLFFKRKLFNVPLKALVCFALGGLLISVHWILFFHAIKISSVSVTLSVLSSASLMTSFLEPLFYKRKIRMYEVFFGVFVVIGLSVIFKAEQDSSIGIYVALLSTLLSVLFTLLNGKLIEYYQATSISFYQLLSGSFFLSIWLIFILDIPTDFFVLKGYDPLWIFLLASFCTAYAFIASVEIMKQISPYTIMISLNMEPVYAILFSIYIFGEKEIMSVNFYLGVLIILISVLGNGIYKARKLKKTN